MLETKRLILRKLELTDAERIEAFASDYDVAKTTLNIPHPYPEGSAVDFIEHMLTNEQEGKVVIYAIVEKKAQTIIGLINLSNNQTHKHGELGYWIGKPYWNKGYGTEATLAVVDQGFNTLQLNKIFARAYANNPGSWRIMEKVGMTYEGKLKQHYMRLGEYVDIVLYGLLKDDYQGINNTL